MALLLGGNQYREGSFNIEISSHPTSAIPLKFSEISAFPNTSYMPLAADHSPSSG